MRPLSLILVLATLLAVAMAVGQYYVPRAYYTIDESGHESPPVPLRRLRRSLGMNPYPYQHRGADANANAHAEANANAYNGGSANAEANAIANANAGNYRGPLISRNGAAPQGGVTILGEGLGNTAWQSGQLQGRSATAGTSVTLGADGTGYYSQYSHVH